MSEIRHNRLTGEWVIIAPERAKRGTNLVIPQGMAEVPAYSPTCPFCPGNEALSSEERFRADGEDGRWIVRSVANKFSALSAEGHVDLMDGCGELSATVNGVGLHEVLVESPRHDLTMALLSVAQIQRVLEAYNNRFLAFHADSRVRHVIIFKNHGADAGASQQHPHSQIVGLPIVPGQVVDRLDCARRFFAETGQCLGCSIIAEEQVQKARVIAENDDFIAFIPYAALSPYHLWIFPKSHSACFSGMPAAAQRDLAELLRTVLAKVYGLLANPPFNLVIRSLTPQEENAAHFHWYISIVPRVNKAGGFEFGTGIYINPSLPELTARALREYSVT